MGPVILLLIIIVAVLVVIRAGAIALELTGLEPEKARFQALSAFTNTGFTTREAEEITHYPSRRRIITVLIVLGYAGTVSVIATLATSFLQRGLVQSLWKIGAALAATLIVYRLAKWQGITKRVARIFRRTLAEHYGVRASSLEQMLRVGEGFGVMRVAVPENSELVGRPLVELGLKTLRVQILSIIRGDITITIPQGTDMLLAGDLLVCYGDIHAVKRFFAPAEGASAREDRGTGDPAGQTKGSGSRGNRADDRS